MSRIHCSYSDKSISNNDENEVLALLTANPAAILGKDDQFGKLDVGANFLVASGTPGLEITDVADVKAIYFQGVVVIDRMRNN